MQNPNLLPRVSVFTLFPAGVGQVLETGGMPTPSQEVASAPLGRVRHLLIHLDMVEDWRPLPARSSNSSGSTDSDDPPRRRVHRFDWHLGYEDGVSPPPLQPPQPPLPVRRLHEERGRPEQRGIDLRNRLSQRGQQGGCRVPLAPRLEREEDDDENFGGGNGRALVGRSWTDVLFRRGRSREPQGGNDGRYRSRTPRGGNRHFAGHRVGRSPARRPSRPPSRRRRSCRSRSPSKGRRAVSESRCLRGCASQGGGGNDNDKTSSRLASPASGRPPSGAAPTPPAHSSAAHAPLLVDPALCCSVHGQVVGATREGEDPMFLELAVAAAFHAEKSANASTLEAGASVPIGSAAPLGPVAPIGPVSPGPVAPLGPDGSAASPGLIASPGLGLLELVGEQMEGTATQPMQGGVEPFFAPLPPPLVATPPVRRRGRPRKKVLLPSRHSKRLEARPSPVLISMRAQVRIMKEMRVLKPGEPVGDEAVAEYIKRFQDPLPTVVVQGIRALTGLDSGKPLPPDVTEEADGATPEWV